MNFDISNHLQHFPHAAIMEKEGRMYGLWMVGSNYKRETNYHGAYPPKYIERVLSLVPDRKKILHLFSGSLKREGETTFDCNPELVPDVCGNAEEIDKHFAENSFDLVLADPPYTAKHAEIYGTKMPRSNVVLQKLYNIVEKGGCVVYLSTKPPLYRKVEWGLAGVIGFHCGTNREFRCVTFLERI